MLSSQGRLSAGHGIVRGREDRMRGQVIEALLARGHGAIAPCLLEETRAQLAPFLERDLVRLTGNDLAITPGGLPYARVIASLFDAYRKVTQRSFSAAI
jgi:oxygen-independent coproporphyrinogen-3 oxidase